MSGADPQPAVAKPNRRWLHRSLRALLVVMLVVIPCSWLAVAIHEASEAATACRSQAKLNQLQLALCNYESAHGHFPPAYIADKDGTPMHSWRVLVLPFIDEGSLHRAYNFSEPWNSPHNSKLADKMPSMFHMPSEPSSTSMTNIVAITGPGTAFPGARSTRKAEFTDGSDNTILLAEIADSNINWLEPRDLQVEEMSFAVNDKRKPSISSSRRRGPYVVFGASIHAHQVSPSLQPEALRALTTIAGGRRCTWRRSPNVGLTSPAPGPATDEKVRQLNHNGLRHLWLNRSDVTDGPSGNPRHALRLPGGRKCPGARQRTAGHDPRRTGVGVSSSRRVGIYANARDILGKTDIELASLRQRKLHIVYLGLESGSDEVLRRVHKGITAAEMVEAVQRLKQAGMRASVIGLLGLGGTELSAEHAEATGRVVSVMDPEYFSMLTVMLIPGTELHRQRRQGAFKLPVPEDLLLELRQVIEKCDGLSRCVFRTDHASNYLPLAGTLSRNKAELLASIDGRWPRDDLHFGQRRGGPCSR